MSVPRLLSRWLAPLLILILFAIGSVEASPAGDLAKPSGPIILTVSGSVGRTNSTAGAVFDYELLDKLPQSHVITETPWTQGPRRFEGVLLRDLLDFVDAKGATIHAVAVNEYKADLPVADVRQYDVLLATSLDGKRLTLRDKGPIWIIYPLSDHPSLRQQEVHARMVWQLKELVVR